MDYTLIDDIDEFNNIYKPGGYICIDDDNITYKIITISKEGIHNTYIYNFSERLFIKLSSIVGKYKYTVKISQHLISKNISISIYKGKSMLVNIINPIDTNNLEIKTFAGVGDGYDYCPDVPTDLEGRLSKCNFSNLYIDDVISYFNEIRQSFLDKCEDLNCSSAQYKLLKMNDILTASGNYQEIGNILRTIIKPNMESHVLLLPMVII